MEGRDGESIIGLVGIAERVEEYYRELFREEKVDGESMRRIVGKLRRRLSEAEKEECDVDIGEEEIIKAINGMNKNKSPGLDGLTAEFYREFREQLCPILGKLFRWMEDHDYIETEIITGLVNIIHKKGSKDKLDNYRPLTMLNVDYKILARVMSERIKKVISTVVGGTQAYSVPGRNIVDTVRSVRDVVGYMKEKGEGIVLSLDLNKAFDRVNHDYLFRVLETVGFGERMVGWIKRMYKGAVSCVKINGLLTDVFRVERSVRQGCPMSSLLYSISAEPLAMLLEGDEGIRGIEIPGGNVSLMYQYADDTTVTVGDRDSVYGVFRCVEEYGCASGVKINMGKSEIMYMDVSMEERVQLSLRERRDYVRVLGINVGIEQGLGNQIQFDEIIGKMSKVLGFWKSREVGLRGKVIIVNMLVMSKLIYVMSVMNVPNDVVLRVNELVGGFLWGGRGVRIAREVLENEYEDGGLKLFDLEIKKKALRIKTMIQFLKGKTNFIWKSFLKDAILKTGGCGSSGIFMEYRESMLKGVSEYYREVLEAWGEFLGYVSYNCVNIEQVCAQPIFLNPKIKVRDKTLFDRKMWDAGFRTLSDLVYEYVPGFMSAQVIVDEVREKGQVVGLKMAEHLLSKIKSGVPKGWMEIIECEIVEKGMNEIEMYVGVEGKGISIVNMKTSLLYKVLKGKKVRRPASERVWEEVVGRVDVGRIWKSLRVKWNCIECENFDFMLRHNRIFNNLIISKFDVRVNKECDVCRVEVETCMHEFVECSELTVFFW